MDNILKVSGLGFDMEFAMSEIYNNGLGKFYTSKKYDDPCTELFKSIEDFKASREDHSIHSKGAKVTYGTFIEMYNTHLDEFNSCIMLMPLKCSTVISCSKLDRFEDMFNPYRTALFCRSASSQLLIVREPKRLRDFDEELYSTLINEVYKYIEDNCLCEESVDDISVEEKKRACVKLLLKMQRCLCLYVAKYLKLDVKYSCANKVFADQVTGRFSSTYNLKVEFNGSTTSQSVRVKSDN